MRPKARRVSAKTVRDLLAAGDAEPDESLSKELTFCSVYNLDHGQVLLVFDSGRGVIYESRDQLVRMYEEAVQRAARKASYLAELLPQGQDFAAQVSRLVAELPGRLSLDPGVLDYSETSLIAIDAAIRKLGPHRVLTPDMFPPLTAYVGEVIRRATAGSWEMRLDRDGETWVPWVVGRSGQEYPPTRISKELLEYGRSASLRTFVSGTIGANLLKRQRT